MYKDQLVFFYDVKRLERFVFNVVLVANVKNFINVKDTEESVFNNVHLKYTITLRRLC
jgi:hypothetical protein